jgi:hypothetical protein
LLYAVGRISVKEFINRVQARRGLETPQIAT